MRFKSARFFFATAAVVIVGVTTSSVASAQGFGFYPPVPAFGPPVVVVARPAIGYPAVASIPTPYVAARPAVPYYGSAPVAVYAAPVTPVIPVYRRPVVVSTKFYVPGQPVRNAWRAITP